MSRRRGQNGYLEKSGHWWVVRFWADVPGQTKRVHRRERVCPIKGPGAKNKSERERAAKEIIAASRVDTIEHFEKVVRNCSRITFREQGQAMISNAQQRSKPPRESTIIFWQTCLKRLNPLIGDLPLEEIRNGTLKKVVEDLRSDSSKSYAAQTIQNTIALAKKVVKSAVDQDGNQLFPRSWNNAFIDAPCVEKDEQNTPCFDSATMNALAAIPLQREGLLYALAGATGMRIGELLGIEIDKHISTDFRTISVVQQIYLGKKIDRLKTMSGRRLVDLHPEMAERLRQFIGDRTEGYLFCGPTGNPLSYTCASGNLSADLLVVGYRRPTGVIEGAGFHAFRRFRVTHLRGRARCPERLLKFWLGHAEDSMGDRYDKTWEDRDFRLHWAELAGFGFQLPPVEPIVPKEDLTTRVTGS